MKGAITMKQLFKRLFSLCIVLVIICATPILQVCADTNTDEMIVLYEEYLYINHSATEQNNSRIEMLCYHSVHANVSKIGNTLHFV